MVVHGLDALRVHTTSNWDECERCSWRQHRRTSGRLRVHAESLGRHLCPLPTLHQVHSLGLLRPTALHCFDMAARLHGTLLLRLRFWFSKARLKMSWSISLQSRCAPDGASTMDSSCRAKFQVPGPVG